MWTDELVTSDNMNDKVLNQYMYVRFLKIVIFLLISFDHKSVDNLSQNGTKVLSISSRFNILCTANGSESKFQATVLQYSLGPHFC